MKRGRGNKNKPQMPTKKAEPVKDPEQVKAIIDSMPSDKREMIIAELVSYQGPLPHPGIIREYESIVEGSADRIINAFEEQRRHRHQIENDVIRNGMKIEARGQIFAFILGIVAIAAGAFLTYFEHDTVGGVIFGTTVVGLIVAFVSGRTTSTSTKGKDGVQ